MIPTRSLNTKQHCRSPHIHPHSTCLRLTIIERVIPPTKPFRTVTHLDRERTTDAGHRSYHGRLVVLGDVSAGSADRESDVLESGRHSHEPGNIGYDKIQDCAAKRRHAIIEEADRQQESEHTNLGSQVDRHVCKEWRTALPDRDSFQRIHGQSGLDTEGVRRSRSGGQGEDLGTHTELGECLPRTIRPGLHSTSVPILAKRWL